MGTSERASRGSACIRSHYLDRFSPWWASLKLQWLVATPCLWDLQEAAIPGFPEARFMLPPLPVGLEHLCTLPHMSEPGHFSIHHSDPNSEVSPSGKPSLTPS